MKRSDILSRPKISAFMAAYGIWVLVALHFFGLMTMLMVDLNHFASYTPLNLLVSAAVLYWAAPRYAKPGMRLFFLSTFFIGYAAEYLGTQTGFPFGNYLYLDNLRPHLGGVPVVIGVNWFLLAYASAQLTDRFVRPAWLRVLSASALMVLLDFFIEPVAGTLGYWQWENDIIPWQNYLGWFGVSIIIQSIYQRWSGAHSNRWAQWYNLIVLIFFVILNLAL